MPWPQASVFVGAAMLFACSDDRLTTVPPKPEAPPRPPVEDCGPIACERLPQCIPPQTFQPDMRWKWTSTFASERIIATPVVSKLYADEPPVVIAVMYSGVGPNDLGLPAGRLVAISGENGEARQDFSPPEPVEAGVTPTVADLDGDGAPEIITMRQHTEAFTHEFTLYAFDREGQLLWESDPFLDFTHLGYTMGWLQLYSGPSVADLDADGAPEVIIGATVFSNEGELLWQGDRGTGQAAAGHFSSAVDLDSDGQLELVTGNTAYNSDGTIAWEAPIPDGSVAIADCDADGFPEIFVSVTRLQSATTTELGFAILEHDGAIRVPFGPPPSPVGGTWARFSSTPAAGDLNGDGRAEWAVSFQGSLSVLDCDGQVLWQQSVSDASGIAGPIIFDFEGDGAGEVIFNDEVSVRIFRGTDGSEIYEAVRRSETGYETPAVADIDDDGHAELLVADAGAGAPGGVRAYSNVSNNWAATYPMWTQHGFYVSHIDADGSIPRHPEKHWLQANVFRGNASYCRE